MNLKKGVGDTLCPVVDLHDLAPTFGPLGIQQSMIHNNALGNQMYHVIGMEKESAIRLQSS